MVVIDRVQGLFAGVDETHCSEAGRISAWQLTMLQLNYDVTTR